MNANQIINMVIRQITRIAVNKGVKMGMKGASSAAQKVRAPKQPAGDDVYIDDFGNTVQRKNPPRS